MKNLWAVLVVLILVCMPVLATATEYEIVPYTGPERGMYEGGGADGTLSFWDLPLALKIAHISTLLAASIAIWKILPLILGKITQKYKNSDRERILNYIEANPGSTTTDIEKNLGMKRSTVRHHLRILRLNYKITRSKKGKSVLYFRNSCQYTETEKKIICCLRNDAQKSILLSILQKPGITNQDLTQTFNLAKSTVHWHIDDMHNEGLVDYENDGKYKRYFINPAVEKDLKNIISVSESDMLAG
jgi:predicted transcriptional regulator